MPKITTQAGPWNMTVFAFDADDPENPLARLPNEDLSRIPFGAAELTAEGRVVSHFDTEPDGAVAARPPFVGRSFFADLIPWSVGSPIVEEFKKGVAEGSLNVVFDCADPRLAYKVRVHLKISPILGTFWAFVKRLRREAFARG